MYNQELKYKFIEDCVHKIDSNLKAYKRLFDIVGKYEEKWDADICTRGADELQPVIDDICGIRDKSKYPRLIALKKYVNWCIDQGVPGACNGMLQLSDTGAERVKRYYVANAKHLQSYLDTMFAPESEKTIDNIYRCYYWLAYGGLREEDVPFVKCSDVDFNEMMVRYDKRYTALPIYREGLRAFHNCVELDSFVLKHPLYAKEVKRKRLCGDELMRGSKSVLSVKSIRSRISKISRENRGKTDLKLSYHRVWLSGMFYRIWEQEVIGIPPFFEDIASDDVKGKEYKAVKSGVPIDNIIRSKAKEYKNDYDRWKIAWKLNA